MGDGRQLSRVPIVLAFLIFLQTVVCCISLIYTSYFHDNFHIYYEPASLYGAAAVVATFALAASLFVFVSFSFGYFVAYYFYTMVVGFLWMNYFTDLNYNHQQAGLSAAVSAIAFFLPALIITSPVRQTYAMSRRVFERLLVFILVLAGITIVIGATYNFRIIGLG